MKGGNRILYILFGVEMHVKDRETNKFVQRGIIRHEQVNKKTC